jgi:hypothetical protein
LPGFGLRPQEGRRHRKRKSVRVIPADFTFGELLQGFGVERAPRRPVMIAVTYFAGSHRMPILHAVPSGATPNTSVTSSPPAVRSESHRLR